MYLLQAATTQPTEMILLVELLALRTIVVNLQFALAHGEPPTVEAMQRLIERADLEKVRPGPGAPPCSPSLSH